MKKIIPFICIFALFGCNFISSDSSDNSQTEANSTIRSKAVQISIGKLGCPYSLGSDGPSSFDCSGLIVYSYQTALNKKNIFVNSSGGVVSDANIESLFLYNTNLLSVSNVDLGDIIFIGTNKLLPTHGGIVCRIADNKVEFIHASSTKLKVVRDTADVSSGDIIAYGRIKYCD